MVNCNTSRKYVRPLPSIRVDVLRIEYEVIVERLQCKSIVFINLLSFISISCTYPKNLVMIILSLTTKSLFFSRVQSTNVPRSLLRSLLDMHYYY